MQHNGHDITLGNNTQKYITETAVHKTVNITTAAYETRDISTINMLPAGAVPKTLHYNVKLLTRYICNPTGYTIFDD